MSKLEKIKKYCKNKIKKPIGIYDWRGELVYTVREHQKICNHILQIIESED